MAAHNDLGSAGEQLAAEWLTVKGYEILHRNWKQGPCELDIIARYKDVYHFIEVKTGRSSTYGYPEQRVSRRKLQNMMRAGAAWLHTASIGAKTRVQYDVVAIVIRKGAAPEFFLFGDVSL